MPSAHPRLAALLLVSVASFAGCGKESSTPAAPPPTAVTVVTLTAQPLAIERELTGRTTPFLIAEVRPQVNGIIEKQLFVEGSLVKAGQPLYQLDDATYRAELANTQAALARAQASAESTRLNAARSAELLKIDAVSRQDHENAVAAARQAEADVKAAQAAIQGANILVGYGQIVSPITGRIGKSSVTQGALVTANQESPLVTVQTLDPIYVDVTQSSAELLALRREIAAGTMTATDDVPVKILLEDGSEYGEPGTLKFTDVTVDPETGSYSLRVQVPNPDNLLLPGMYVRAVLANAMRQDAILVPQPAIQRTPKGDATAMVVGAGNKVEMRNLDVSRTVGDQWLVEKGLAPGDRVIVAGLQKVQPGAVVNPTERGAATPDAQPGKQPGKQAGKQAATQPGTAPAASNGTD